MMNYATVTYRKKKPYVSIDLPSSKSISNRVLIIQELMPKQSVVSNYSNSNDTIELKNLLQTSHDSQYRRLHVSDGGTSFRFALAYLASSEGHWILECGSRLMERPINPLVETLRALGADIEYLGLQNKPPIQIIGRKLIGKTIEIDNSQSSQFVSALLLIAPTIKNGLTIILKDNNTSNAYIDLTIGVMREFGAQIERTNQTIVVKEKPYYRLEPFHIESDWSSAGPWYLLQSIIKEGTISLKGLSNASQQPDARLLKIFESIGVQSRTLENNLELLSTPHTIAVDNLDLSQCPDSAMAIALAYAVNGFKCKISGLQTLNQKECRRLDVLSQLLLQFGYSNNTMNEDTLILGGDSDPLTNNEAIVQIENDHRMAMAFAVLAASVSPIMISDPDCVSKSYPNFWEDLQKAGFDII